MQEKHEAGNKNHLVFKVLVSFLPALMSHHKIVLCSYGGQESKQNAPRAPGMEAVKAPLRPAPLCQRAVPPSPTSAWQPHTYICDPRRRDPGPKVFPEVSDGSGLGSLQDCSETGELRITIPPKEYQVLFKMRTKLNIRKYLWRERMSR